MSKQNDSIKADKVSGGVFVDAKINPPKGDLYFTKIRMKDTDLDWFPSTNNFYGSWEVDEGYEVVAWLDESLSPSESAGEISELKKENDYWKNRCLAAEYLISSSAKTDIPIGYKNWHSLKYQSPGK